jgi:hypothetical protein
MAPDTVTRKTYLCFTQDHNLEAAIQSFRDRYHMEPKGHKYEYGILWVGPIPGSEEHLFNVNTG